MKNHFFATLILFCMTGTIAVAQTKKPTTTRKPSTTVKTTPSKTTTKTTTTTTTTTPVVTTPVEEKKTTTTTTTTNSPTQSTPTSTTTTQSSGPSKGNKNKVTEPKPEKVKEPKVEKVKEPKPERVKTPKTASSGDGGVKFGIRAEASQLFILNNKIGGDVAISPGFNAGLIVNLPLSEKISIQPEVLYSMKVAQSKEVSSSFEKTTFSSILVPVTLNINLGQGPTKFMVNLGGFADYLLGINNESTVSGVKTSSSLDLTNVDKFDYGAVVGLGAKINNKFIVEARTFYSLKDNTQSSVFVTLGIGYMF